MPGGLARSSVMRDIDLFQAALGLSPPFVVERCELDVDKKQLDLWVDFARGSRFACAGCGRAGCAAHDSAGQTWRHLDFFQHKAFLHCRVPRSHCPDCGVLKVKVPWARAGSGFTLLFEAMLVAMVKHMPVGVVARMVDEHDTRLWRVLEHYVGKALDAMDLSQLRQIGVDETSARRGHDYVSLFVDLAQRQVVYAGDGKGAETVEEFGAWLEDHGGTTDQISDVSMDMSAAFVSGARKTFPKAKITFDKFHVIQLVNKAVDEVRREERRKNPLLKGARYIFLKNKDNLTHAQRLRLAALEGTNLDTLQAWQIRINLQDVFDRPSVSSARRFLQTWAAWVRTSGLKPMIKAAKTIMRRAGDILRSIETGLSNGIMEAINANVQAAKRKAKGYRTKRNLKMIIYLTAGHVLDRLPT